MAEHDLARRPLALDRLGEHGHLLADLLQHVGLAVEPVKLLQLELGLEVLDCLQQLEPLALYDAPPSDALLLEVLKALRQPLVPRYDPFGDLGPQRIQLRVALTRHDLVLLRQVVLHCLEHVDPPVLLCEQRHLNASDIVLDGLQPLLLLLVLCRRTILHLAVDGPEFIGEVSKLSGDVLPPCAGLLLGLDILLRCGLRWNRYARASWGRSRSWH
mmetsp:Transcript_65797/g.130396  ORF Transcript_65797/g.130396 Transcript_65797/m.130396 type:complete len:215 (-) Transcript_65797:72-716(-)